MIYLNFIKNESGAVTVDYVVVLAAFVALGFAISEVVGSAAAHHSNTLHQEFLGNGFVTPWDQQLAFPPNPDICAACQ